MSGITPEVTPSRILPPVLPPNFLSRRHLFQLIDDRAPGYTMVVAPTGYGKTTLLAEWAAQSEKKVIWYTMSESDSPDGIAHHLLRAIKEVIPDFETDPNLISVATIFRAIAKLNEDVVLVLDNVVDAFTYQLNVTQSYMDAIPDNVHIFALRKLMPTVSLQRFASIGRVSIITAGDLVFSRDEVESLLSVYGVKFPESKIDEIAMQTHGWPAAVAIVASGGSNKVNLEVDDELVEKLIKSKFELLSKDNQEMLLAMSSFEGFDLNLIRAVTKKKVNEASLNKLASEGIFLMLSAGQASSFIFNSTARVVIDEMARLNIKAYRENLINAAEHFQSQGLINSAISSAINSGDSDYLRKMFKPALRKLVSRGEGSRILHWIKFLPVDSTRNRLFTDLTRIMGHLVGFDFDRTIQLVEEMRFSYQETELMHFVERVSAVTLAHISFCRGRLGDFDKNIEIVLSQPRPIPDIDSGDLISMLRLYAARSFIFEDAEKLKSIEIQAGLISQNTDSTDDLFHLKSIKLMKLFLDGEYLAAFETAVIVNEMSERNEYYGVSASCEAIYVKARCYLEFNEPEKADLEFKLLAERAREWNQWPWVFMAESYQSRALIVNGKVEDAFAVVKEHRKMAADFKGEDGLSLIIDINELFLRFWMRDFERSKQILNRIPQDLLAANRYRTALSAAGNEDQKVKEIPQALPTDTARESIWKAIVNCSANIDQESIALEALRIALDVGARVGAKETFLRQDPKILELIIRSASIRPTVYLEDLARSAAQRMNGRKIQGGSLADPLTKREIDVLRSLASGKPITVISKNLHISHNTMKTHLRNIYRKLKANGRDQAVEKAQALFII